MKIMIKVWVEEDVAAELPEYARLKGYGSVSGACRIAIEQLMTRNPLTKAQEARKRRVSDASPATG